MRGILRGVGSAFGFLFVGFAEFCEGLFLPLVFSPCPKGLVYFRWIRGILRGFDSVTAFFCKGGCGLEQALVMRLLLLVM